MIYCKEFKNHTPEILGNRKKFDNTIYTFDIETTSYFELDNKYFVGMDYENLSDDEKERCTPHACMYLWQFSINKNVYYGRTWDEFKEFLDKLEKIVPEKKYVFVHNLSFEFQFFKSYFNIENVTARKSHKVMTCELRDYNIMFKCSAILSNCKLEYLPKTYNLPVEKLVGNLDYYKIRTSITPLTDEELKYGEYDCLVVYYYIKRELETYLTVSKLPTTSTSKVRRELFDLIIKDFKYKRITRKAINTDTHIYNMLIDAFMGGYTHSNWIYTSEVLKDVDSYDETSAYPYVLVANKYPMSEFKRCYITKVSEMSKNICYLLIVKFKNIKCKYYNNFISMSKCRNIRGGKYDNGRIIRADELEITLTDIDFYLILDTYKCEYEILEIYYASYNYLPKKYINFVLDKYVKKTEFKDVEGKEIEYQIEKAKFNSLYGMTVTNMIKDDVNFNDLTKEWSETELTNDEIIEKLKVEKNKGFLSFSWGVWCTAYARNNLLRRVIDLDEFVVYCDTDSIKLVDGYDKSIFEKYNKSVENRIKYVADVLSIDFNKYCPADKNGKKHLLGVFENETKNGRDHTYDEFITQGAKKYCVKVDDKIKITVAGVPKNGAVAIKDLHDFNDNLVFKFEDTNKLLLTYCENQELAELIDYLGNKYIVNDKSGCCLLPTTYILSRALDYADLIDSDSSERARFKEELTE